MRTAVVLGKGDLAIKVANWFLQSEQYKLAAIVPVIPEPGWTHSFADWGRASNVHVIASGHYRDLPQIAPGGEGIDLAVSVFYDKIIKAWFIDSCKKIINLHNGPLPRYRGVSPINWALKNGEHEHGVTLHEITPGIDDGPILGQVKYSIYPESDEVIDVYRRALEYGWTLFQQTIPLLDQITPRSQNEADALYYSKLDDPRLGDRTNFTRATSVDAPH
jgi:methionyl-tRNA formyltransferase